jgi:hypothetical protein
MAWEQEATLVVRLKSKYPKDYLERVGREIIRTIRARTESGKDKNGSAFKGYSEEYKDSLEFRIAGKSESHVNLRLTGEMMSGMEVLWANPASGSVAIGFRDTGDRGKAHGHITGANGRLPIRDFLGISNDELATILSKVPDPDKLLRAQAIAAKELAEKESQQQKDRGRPEGFFIVDLIKAFDDIAKKAEIL